MKYTYCFNQLRDNDAGNDALFLSYRQISSRGGVDLENYWTADFGTIEAISPLAACGELYRKYNRMDPWQLKGYDGRSMSVSDVVELWTVDTGEHTVWFCDSFGFVQLPQAAPDTGAKSEFRIIVPTGETVYVVARTRAEAIREYCAGSGCPEEFVKQHCVIKRMGRRA